MEKINSPQKIILKVSLRQLTGKKVKKLRNQGVVPASIYGADFKSQAVSVNFEDFIKIYKVVKETGIVYLDLEGKEIPALIKNVQKHPINDQIFHVDFRKVDLKNKIVTEVPIKIVGESPAVKNLGGVLLTQAETILVEALPKDIPQEIEVDISSLREIGQEIKVGDLANSEKYQVKTNAEKVVVSVVAHKEESTAPDTTAVSPEVITESKKAQTEATVSGGNKLPNQTPQK